MPLEIASTPVRAVQPLAKARRMRKRPSDPAAGSASRGVPVAAEHADEADRDQDEDADDEAVGRQGEDGAALAHAAQIAERHQNEEGEAERHGEARQLRRRGDEGEHPRRHAHRDVEHVVEHQRRRRDEAGRGPEVRAGDEVGAAAAGVGGDRLPIGDAHQQQQGEDGEGDRHERGEPRRPAEDEDDQRRLGAIGDGGERVRGEDRERPPLRQSLVHRLLAGERPPDHRALDLMPGATRCGIRWPRVARSGNDAPDGASWSPRGLIAREADRGRVGRIVWQQVRVTVPFQTLR